jgi:hypothetical protein
MGAQYLQTQEGINAMGAYTMQSDFTFYVEVRC